MRPRTLEEVVRRTRAEGDWELQVGAFLDAFYAAEGSQRSGFVSDEPALLGDDLADAYIGAVGEHLARRWSLPIPRWVRDPHRYLTLPHFQPDVPAFKPYLLRASPVAFRTRLIFVGGEPLQRNGFCPDSRMREEDLALPRGGVARFRFWS